mgnify:CR=1 FL=1
MTTTSTNLTVAGMSCQHCVAAVTGEISKLPGVSTVVVDLPTGLVTVTSADPVAADDLARAVDEAGFSVVPA